MRALRAASGRAGPYARVAFVVALGPAPLPGNGSLEWDAPGDRCPDAAHVVSLLGEHIRDTSIGTSVHAQAEATELTDASWSIRLQLRTDDTEPTVRSFSVGSCEAGAQAVALALALAMQAEDSIPSDPPDDPPPPAIVPPPLPLPKGPDASTAEEPASLPTPPADRADRRPSEVRAVIGLGAGVVGGILPRAAGLLTGHIGAIGPRWRVLARFDHEIRQDVDLRARSDAGGRLSTYGAAVEAGPVFRVGPLELPLTAGVIAAGVRAQGFGATTNATRTVPWVGLLAGTGLMWAPIPRIALGIRGELVAGLVRHSFGFRPGVPLFTMGWVGGKGFALVEVRLP